MGVAPAGSVGHLTQEFQPHEADLILAVITVELVVRGVRFAPYRNFGTTPQQNRRNRSTFDRCTFTVDMDWPDEPDFKAHVDLWRAPRGRWWWIPGRGVRAVTRWNYGKMQTCWPRNALW